MKWLSPKEEVLRVLEGEDIGYFPRAIPLFSPIVDMMKHTGAYFPAGNYEAEPMARLALAAHELGGWNAVMLPWPSTVESEAMGCEVVSKDDDIAGYPQVKKRAFEDAYGVKLPKDILERGSFPAVFGAFKIVKETIEKKYSGEVLIVALSQGPFTIAGNVVGVDDMFRFVIKDVDKARAVLGVTSDLNIMYINRMLKCGADVVLLADPSAQGLTAPQFEKLLVPIYQKISGSVDARIMLHICGKTSKIAYHLPETGFEGFSFDYPSTTIEDLRKAFGKRLRLIGSVPTLSHLLNGTRKDVIEMTIHQIKEGVDILSPSCGLPQYSPLVNIRAMSDAIEIYNGRRGAGTIE
jgi:[methyl-Co(III) methanol-specific corrinoid protein]:coenzyme M methyltransferase